MGNFGAISMMGELGLKVWHLGADGELISGDILDTSLHDNLHSFAMTNRYLLFVLIPFDLKKGNGAFFERMRLQPEQPLRIAVVSKGTPDLV